MNHGTPDMNPQAQTDNGFFVDSWAVYKKLVAENYMFHREIYAKLKAWLAGRGQPFSLLDLGCGDAANLAGIARDLPVSRYCGVDLSEVALELAAQNLHGLNCPIALCRSDMLAYLESGTTPYDVIFTSFAFHHLNPDEMQRFLAACRHRLSPGGQLVLVDVIRDEGQPLKDYLDAFCEAMRHDWVRLNPEELSHTIRHVRESDRPATLNQLRDLSSQTGFHDMKTVYRTGWYHLLSLHASWRA